MGLRWGRQGTRSATPLAGVAGQLGLFVQPLSAGGTDRWPVLIQRLPREIGFVFPKPLLSPIRCNSLSSQHLSLVCLIRKLGSFGAVLSPTDYGLPTTDYRLPAIGFVFPRSLLCSTCHNSLSAQHLSHILPNLKLGLFRTIAFFNRLLTTDYRLPPFGFVSHESPGGMDRGGCPPSPSVSPCDKRLLCGRHSLFPEKRQTSRLSPQDHSHSGPSPTLLYSVALLSYKCGNSLSSGICLRSHRRGGQRPSFFPVWMALSRPKGPGDGRSRGGKALVRSVDQRG